ncbi:hypothetical protein L6452_01681 [Arctium lappa]|uniref:Uncharacterized protein n=1 Tax=Arctium lappa TaxID=4217 RepID=A0ACB9FI90_ARCLA|nr:hypothetical protein L6452_01681 [Arctium lappa]
MNKPRSEEAIKEKWGLGFENTHFLNHAKIEVPTLYEYDHLGLARYAPQFKFFWTTEKQILEDENEKRMKNKMVEIPFFYTSENAKYFPDQSKKFRKSQNVLNVKSSNKSLLPTEFVDIFANSNKENASPVSYDPKRYILSLVLEGKIVDLEDKLEEQSLQTDLENDLFLFIMKTSFEDKILSGFSINSKENTQVSKNSVHLRHLLVAQSSVCATKGSRKPPPDLCFSEISHSKASSSMSNAQSDFLNKVPFSTSIVDDSLTLNDQYYKTKTKRKRRRSKKSRKHDSVLSENSNSSDSSVSDRTVKRSQKLIWRVKQQIAGSELLGVKCVESLCESDTFAICNKNTKYSIQQMIHIAKSVSYSSSNSDSDDCGFSSIDDCFHENYKNKFSKGKIHKSNKKGPISIWVPKSV